MSLSSNDDSSEKSEDNDKDKSTMFDDEEILDDADDIGEFLYVFLCIRLQIKKNFI